MMKKFKRISLLLGLFLSFSAFADTAEHIDKQLCSTCHGIGGNTTSEQFPMLAGQPKEYLAKELKEFKDKTRGNLNAVRFMQGIASRLSDDEITQLAAYFEAQNPAHDGKISDQKKYDQGKTIFNLGNPAAGLIACTMCHGDKGQGNGAIPTPRLAGQHEEYLKKHLDVFFKHPEQRPDAVAMHQIVKGLTDEDMVAVVHYLQAQ